MHVNAPISFETPLDGHQLPRHGSLTILLVLRFNNNKLNMSKVLAGLLVFGIVAVAAADLSNGKVQVAATSDGNGLEMIVGGATLTVSVFFFLSSPPFHLFPSSFFFYLTHSLL